MWKEQIVCSFSFANMQTRKVLGKNKLYRNEVELFEALTFCDGIAGTDTMLMEIEMDEADGFNAMKLLEGEGE